MKETSPVLSPGPIGEDVERLSSFSKDSFHEVVVVGGYDQELSLGITLPGKNTRQRGQKSVNGSSRVVGVKNMMQFSVQVSRVPRYHSDILRDACRVRRPLGSLYICMARRAVSLHLTRRVGKGFGEKRRQFSTARQIFFLAPDRVLGRPTEISSRTQKAHNISVY